MILSASIGAFRLRQMILRLSPGCWLPREEFKNALPSWRKRNALKRAATDRVKKTAHEGGRQGNLSVNCVGLMLRNKGVWNYRVNSVFPFRGDVTGLF